MPETITSHYYASLCFRGLKRLGLAGSESTDEDKNLGEEMGEIGESFNFNPPMAGGPLFTLVYQIPGYLNPQRPDEMLQIFDGVKHMVSSRTIQHLQREYPERTSEWEKFYIEPGFNSICEPLLEDQDKLYKLIDQFGDYLEQLWPKFEAEYSRWKEGFDFEEWDSQLLVEEVINVWEQVMDISYPYHKFSLVICPESPTTASSLGPEKIVFGARHGVNWAKRSLVHEVGARMVGFRRIAEHLETAQIIADDYTGVLRLIEAEACFRKPQVMDKLGWEYQADQDSFKAGMQLDDLVQMRSEIGEGHSLFDTLATWYHRAKRDGLL